MISKCSGASRLTTSTPACSESTSNAAPCRSIDSRAIAARGSSGSWRSTSAATASASAAEGVINRLDAISSCSACDSRSAAT